MVGRAKPKLAKTYDLSKKKHELLMEAVKLYAAEMEKPAQQRLGARKIAMQVEAEHKRKTNQNIKVSYSTITRIYGGGQSLYEFNKAKALLNQSEEDHCVDYLLCTAARGFPLNHRRLEEVINGVVRNRKPNFEGVGKCYTARFIVRNARQISSYWGNALEQCRARAVNQHTVKAWFDLVEQLVAEHHIRWEDIWGADETGIGMGEPGKERVFGASGKKGQYSSSGGSRENISVMVTIGTRGISIPPFVIFKGQAFMVKWFQANAANAKISYSRKGYMTGEVGLEWIKHFDTHAHPSAPGRARLLLVDGHVSHYSLDLLNYARDHNIILACYPSHTTHVLQGLDVACFARLKQLYSRYATDHERTQGFKVTKSTFLEPFSKAYIETFTSETIGSAFSSTGIHPFNRNIVPPEAMAPSLPTSIQSSLPLTMPDAVAAVARIWDIDPALITDDEAPLEPEIGIDEEVAPRQPPDANTRHAPNPNELVLNTSAAFLANNAPILSTNNLVPLPFHHLPPMPPNLADLGKPSTPLEVQLALQLTQHKAREEALQNMYRGAQAQLVLADRHCTLIQGQLAAKEDRARLQRTGNRQERLMGDGLPRALSHGEFYDERLRRSELAAAHEAEKQRKAAVNARIKELKDEWKLAEGTRKAQNAEARRQYEQGPLAEWIAARDQAKAEGRRLSGMPRPKAPPRVPPLPKLWLEQEQADAEHVIDEPGEPGEPDEEEEGGNAEQDPNSDSELDE